MTFEETLAAIGDNKITELNLCCNNIGHAGVREIAAVLMWNNSMRVVYIGYHNLTQESQENLNEMINSTKILWFNNQPSQLCLEIEEMLTKSIDIPHKDIWNNYWKFILDNKMVISDVIEKKPKLFNQPCYESIKYIADSAKSGLLTKALEVLYLMMAAKNFSPGGVSIPNDVMLQIIEQMTEQKASEALECISMIAPETMTLSGYGSYSGQLHEI